MWHRCQASTHFYQCVTLGVAGILLDCSSVRSFSAAGDSVAAWLLPRMGRAVDQDITANHRNALAMLCLSDESWLYNKGLTRPAGVRGRRHLVDP